VRTSSIAKKPVARDAQRPPAADVGKARSASREIGQEPRHPRRTRQHVAIREVQPHPAPSPFEPSGRMFCRWRLSPERRGRYVLFGAAMNSARSSARWNVSVQESGHSSPARTHLGDAALNRVGRSKAGWMDGGAKSKMRLKGSSAWHWPPSRRACVRDWEALEPSSGRRLACCVSVLRYARCGEPERQSATALRAGSMSTPKEELFAEINPAAARGRQPSNAPQSPAFRRRAASRRRADDAASRPGFFVEGSRRSIASREGRGAGAAGWVARI